jgi:formate dehydrogenase alpha subunit
MDAKDSSEKLKININGIPVEVDLGKTILEAAQSKNIYIPTLCYHPKLTRFGACRLCLVHVEGFRKLVAACTTPVTDGMVVSTDTPEIHGMRKTVVELLLLHHPLDCLVCDKGGDCELQKLAFDLRVTEDRFGYKVREFPLDDTNQVIRRDMSKCVLCGKCIRVCEEIRNIGAIGFANRGFATELGYPYQKLTNCEYCGQCLAVCPVGALSSVFTAMKARPWELTSVRSVCSYCGCGCNFFLDQKRNKVVRVSTDEVMGVNKGLLCVKGRFGFDYVSSDKRLQTPLIRKGNKFVESSWDEALSLVAGTFEKIKQEKGANAIGGIASGRCTNEENYLFQKLMRAVIGTNNVDNFTRYEHAPTLEVFSKSMGFFSGTSSIPQLQNSDLILIVGNNPSHSHPVFALKIKQAVKNNGAKLIVIDPQITELSRFADVYLRLKPNTDIALLNGLMGELIREGKIDEEFIAKRTEGVEEIKAAVKDYSAAQAAADAQVEVEDVKEAARLLGEAKAVSFVFGLGLTQHESGEENVQSLVNLALLTGNIGKSGAGLFPLRVNNNSQGCCDMGNLPDYLPGYQPISSKEVRAAFAEEWQTAIPEEKGLNATQMLVAARNKKLSALFVMGENPALSFPGTQAVEEALDSLDFLVVSDLFLTETAKYAHVVFPVMAFSEKEGTFTSLDRRVQKIRISTIAFDNQKTDWEILCQIASRMGYEMHYHRAEGIFGEIRRVIPFYKGIRYERMEEDLSVQWPCLYDGDPGCEILGVDGFPHGTARFFPITYHAPKLPEDQDYPFTLIQGGFLFHHQTGEMSHKTFELNSLSPSPTIKINPDDATKLGIKDGDRVSVLSKEGQISLVVKISEQFRPGVVFAMKHFSDALPNSLFSGKTGNNKGMPEIKHIQVAIEKEDVAQTEGSEG